MNFVDPNGFDQQAIDAEFGPNGQGGFWGWIGNSILGAFAVAYRYVDDIEANIIRKTGKIPNTDAEGKPKDVHTTSNKYDTQSEAENALQIGSKNPEGPKNSPTYRVQFDNDSVQYHYTGIVEGGTGIEMITSDSIPVDPEFDIFPLIIE